MWDAAAIVQVAQRFQIRGWEKLLTMSDKSYNNSEPSSAGTSARDWLTVHKVGTVS